MAEGLLQMDDNDLLGRIYDAALDQDLWPEVLDGLCRMVDCRTGALLHGQVNPALVTLTGATGLDSSISNRVPEIFSDPNSNPFLQQLPSLKPGVPVSRQTLMDDETFERSPIYTDFFRPQGLYHDVTAPLVLWESEAVGLVLARSRCAGSMDENDVRVLLPWIPHLQRALQVNRELGIHRTGMSALTELLDQISCGIAITRSDGKVVTMNEAVERIVGADDGLSFGNGGLVASSHRDNMQLSEMIAMATAGRGGGSLLIRRPSGERAYPVFILPLPGVTTANRSHVPAAAILISDPEGTMEQHVRIAARLYGLSPAETAVALEIVKGSGRTTVAAKLGISGHTVKTHLGHIFGKTGTSGQVELARLLEGASILRDDAGE